MVEAATFTDRNIIECDWVVLPSWGRLHFTYTELEEGTQGNGVTACGRYGFLCVPGIFTRMGAMRCGRCCDALGYPRGKRSPKNDDACREVLDKRLGYPRPTQEGLRISEVLDKRLADPQGGGDGS